MKKFASFFAAATFVVALASCGSKTAENAETATDSTAVEMTTEAAPVDTAAAAVVDSAAATTDSTAAAQ
jgi:hypothetical protein